MREDLLHYIWKYNKLIASRLTTSGRERVVILQSGAHNPLSGPDFFDARIEIGGQLWAGNVEMHVKASDWYAHHHEEDHNYDNVILHVVWDNDVPVFRKDNTEIPTLELRKFIPPKVLENYHHLFDNRNINFINCEKDIQTTNGFILDNWLERLYFERLEEKSRLVLDLLKEAKNDWEHVLFILLLKNFGSKINGEAFLSLGRALDFKVVQKTRSKPLQLESILFGMAGLLDDPVVKDTYFNQLKKEYHYLKRKFNLDGSSVLRPEFFKLRPSNFPTVRLSQFASLYRRQQLFSDLMESPSREDLYTILKVSANGYWDNHFTFAKVSPGKPKILSPKFMDLLLINTILPLKFCYSKQKGNPLNEELVKIVSELKNEYNNVVAGFKNFGVVACSAKDSQALLQLYNEYCSKNKCLQCAVGIRLLSGK